MFGKKTSVPAPTGPIRFNGNGKSELPAGYSIAPRKYAFSHNNNNASSITLPTTSIQGFGNTQSNRFGLPQVNEEQSNDGFTRKSAFNNKGASFTVPERNKILTGLIRLKNKASGKLINPFDIDRVSNYYINLKNGEKITAQNAKNPFVYELIQYEEGISRPAPSGRAPPIPSMSEKSLSLAPPPARKPPPPPPPPPARKQPPPVAPLNTSSVSARKPPPPPVTPRSIRGPASSAGPSQIGGKHKSKKSRKTRKHKKSHRK
jgi:hypothetical protein